MSDASELPATIPGYNPGSPEVARSPITMEEWEKLKLSAFFSDEDIIYLRLSHDVLKDQVADLNIDLIQVARSEGFNEIDLGADVLADEIARLRGT